MVKRTERGWGGHFIGAPDCYFRRNTLLECGERRVVVSTVGNYKGMHCMIGSNRVYETMAFEAELCGPYWDADVSREVAICGLHALPPGAEDEQANAMHEDAVDEIAKSMA